MARARACGRDLQPPWRPADLIVAPRTACPRLRGDSVATVHDGRFSGSILAAIDPDAVVCRRADPDCQAALSVLRF